MDTNNSESINKEKYLGHRPLCPCCGGGNVRPRYSCSKYSSRKQSNKARRSKPKYKSHRRK